MSERANAFANLEDLSDFGVKPTKDKPDAKIIDKLAEVASFPSRSPLQVTATQSGVRQAQRRHVTGRNRQINIKATEHTINQLYSIADRLNLPLGAVLELALNALDSQKV